MHADTKTQRGSPAAGPTHRIVTAAFATAGTRSPGPSASICVHLRFQVNRQETTAPGGELERSVLQPDGRLVGLGRFDVLDGGGRGDLVRLHADSSVDGSFTPGLVVQYPGVTLVQPDGKLVMGGHYLAEQVRKEQGTPHEPPPG